MTDSRRMGKDRTSKYGRLFQTTGRVQSIEAGTRRRTSIRSFGKFALSEGLLLTFVVLVVLFAFANPKFLSTGNVINILRQTAEIGVGAAGQMVVVTASGIDLSVGSVLALSGVASAILATQGTGFASLGLPAEIALLLALAIGALAGVINGLAVTQLRVAPIIATLASMTFIRGIVYTWTNGIPIYSGLPAMYSWLGAGYVAGVIPVSVVILILTYLTLWLLLHRTIFGTYVYAIGGNAEAARLAGIPIKTVTILTYVLCALLAALVGIMVAGRVHSAQPLAGNGWELDTITAVALGGVSLFGGRGNLLKVFLASLMLALLSNGFVLLGLSSYAQMITKGLILLLAVAFDVLLTQQKKSV
jgi:ribose transport system permease protein